MNEREKIIRLWFDMWLKQQDLGIDKIFTEDVVYTESWCPKYENLKTVKHWFNEWNTRGKVIIWDIKQFFHKENQTVVEWYFKNEMNTGSVEEFDGISLIEWTEDNKIKSLKEYGYFLLHTIVTTDPYPSIDPWMEKYIFPNALLPTLKSIRSATKGLLYEWDCHEFGFDYDKTLMAWWKNFSNNWQKLKDASQGQYDENFYRIWKYYLQTGASSFRTGRAKLYQIVLGLKPRPTNYLILR